MKNTSVFIWIILLIPGCGNQTGRQFSGCNDISEIQNIILDLFRRGYSRREIAGIWGGNITRWLICCTFWRPLPS
ncbi:MAG: membrane dipeptidase [Bacteroidales bacterium]|nr:membrane dipeptidase [Bacteroidales bacterium]MBN2698188.1 membrane dipeptidase [Bacteroidales bacterium]